MRKPGRKLSSLFALMLVPARLLAASEPSDAVVLVTDTRKLHGWEAWWGNLYNGEH